jgi:hypothetical protein
MSDKSPLFVSSLELIAHSTELFAQKNSKKYKFIILHLANAVELLLKDCVIDQGISIYEAKTNRTIGIWDCIGKLKGKGFDTPELPIIELLIDDRNTIQHRFGHPSAESVYYYIEQVISFFQRVLNDHYNLQLAEALKPHLSQEHLKLLGLIKDEYDYLDRLAAISREVATIQAFKIVEQELQKLWEPIFTGKIKLRRVISWRSSDLDALFDDLIEKGYLPKDIKVRFQILREARDYAAHSSEEDMSKINWQVAFDNAKILISGLQKASNAGYTFVPGPESDKKE